MFQTVQCVVVHAVCVQQLGGDGNSVNSQEIVGLFETPRDAEQLLADLGFTRTPWDIWTQHNAYRRGYVQRMVIERK